ncbi:TatD family hydrolase [Eggerthellaceae bacterium 3-80]|nr:TatD family deoxyribonuclease [bacterium D16-34]
MDKAGTVQVACEQPLVPQIDAGIDRFSGEPLFDDALFRQKRKKGKYRVVEPPNPALEGFVADTHAHVHLLASPAAALAKAAVYGVDFICDIVDVYEDEPDTFDVVAHALQQARDLVYPFAQTAREAYGASALFAKTNAALDVADALVAQGESPAHAFVLPEIRFALGCHPHNAKHYDERLEDDLIRRAQDSRVCAIGEIGLDYHYDFSPREDQRRVFRAQIRVARKLGLPVALHLREAHDEAFKIMSEEGFPQAGVLLHCFNLDESTLAPWVEAGCYIAFGGPLTFKSTDEVRTASLRVPLDRLLTETDSPYMTPEPMRGMSCEPAHTIFTAGQMASVRGYAAGQERQAFLTQLYSNAHELLYKRTNVEKL